MNDIKTILPTVFGGQKKLSMKMHETILKKKWSEIVGEDIANKSQPIKIDKNKLYISVIDSNWNNHLFMMKRELLNKIRDNLLINKLNDIIFFVGAINNNKLSDNKLELEDIKLPLVSLEAEEYHEIDSKLCAILDNDLKNIIRKVLIKDLQRKKALLKLGHEKCSVCGVVCLPTKGLCSVCYLEKIGKINRSIEEILLLMPWLQYDQLKEIFFCEKSAFFRVKSNLENYYLSRLKIDIDNKKILLNYVMLINGISVENLSEEIIEKTLMRAKIKLKFPKREKKNVSTYRQ